MESQAPLLKRCRFQPNTLVTSKYKLQTNLSQLPTTSLLQQPSLTTPTELNRQRRWLSALPSLIPASPRQFHPSQSQTLANSLGTLSTQLKTLRFKT